MNTSRAIRRHAALAILLGALPGGVTAQAPADDKARLEEERKLHDESVKRTLDVFEIEIKAKEEGVRVTAVEKLSQVKDKKVLDRLSRVISGTDTDPVKTQAVRAVGGYTGDKAAARVLVNSLSVFKKKPEVLVAVIESLGEVGDRSVVPQILDLYKDRNNQVARAAIVASARLRDRIFIEPLIKLTREFEEEIQAPVGGVASPVDEERTRRKADLQDAVGRALGDITSQSFSTAKEWDTWWKKNKGTFRTDPDPKK
jgi:HEAT repeat protein